VVDQPVRVLGGPIGYDDLWVVKFRTPDGKTAWSVGDYAEPSAGPCVGGGTVLNLGNLPLTGVGGGGLAVRWCFGGFVLIGGGVSLRPPTKNQVPFPREAQTALIAQVRQSFYLICPPVHFGLEFRTSQVEEVRHGPSKKKGLSSKWLATPSPHPLGAGWYVQVGIIDGCAGRSARCAWRAVEPPPGRASPNHKSFKPQGQRVAVDQGTDRKVPGASWLRRAKKSEILIERQPRHGFRPSDAGARTMRPRLEAMFVGILAYWPSGFQWPGQRTG